MHDCGPWVIVGLGNPGAEYAETRHNTGMRAVLALAERWKIRLEPGPGPYFWGRGGPGGVEARLGLPSTFMNESGRAVKSLLADGNLAADRLLLLTDDLELPLGRIRIRPGGGDGGHRGLMSVIYHLQTEEFARLRMGIGSPPPGVDPRDFVLEPFPEEDREKVDQMVRRASLAVEQILGEGLEMAMNRFNPA